MDVSLLFQKMAGFLPRVWSITPNCVFYKFYFHLSIIFHWNYSYFVAPTVSFKSHCQTIFHWNYSYFVAPTVSFKSHCQTSCPYSYFQIVFVISGSLSCSFSFKEVAHSKDLLNDRFYDKILMSSSSHLGPPRLIGSEVVLPEPNTSLENKHCILKLQVEDKSSEEMRPKEYKILLEPPTLDTLLGSFEKIKKQLNMLADKNTDS